jgi:hypothetical protein
MIDQRARGASGSGVVAELVVDEQDGE